jgi:hypothetical protein
MIHSHRSLTDNTKQIFIEPKNEALTLIFMDISKGCSHKDLYRPVKRCTRQFAMILKKVYKYKVALTSKIMYI